MKKQSLSLALAIVLMPATPVFGQEVKSKYVGEEHRIIKSLSPDDIAELKKGGGWGLAKVAELNGVPGPAHILEMQEKIHLTADQKQIILNIYKKMKARAMELGEELIRLESRLNDGFINKTITRVSLKEEVREIEKVRAELRIVHLSTHLQTPNILTKDQITLYNKLRGYSKDPCQNIPEGHNAEMWKKHNGCK